jgi:hypothetical protein
MTSSQPRRMSCHRMRLAGAIALGAMLGGGCAAHTGTSAAASAASTTRTAGAVLADAVQATGGAAAWNAHATAHIKLEVTFAAMGFGGPAERFETRANKSLTVTSLPAVGEVREGSNGRVFWSQDPINGLRFLSGAEAEQARLESTWNPDLAADTLFSSVALANDAPAGLECLLLTPKLGPPIRNCYDRHSHLQVLQEGTHTTPQGDVPFRSTMSDWRDVDGIKVAFVTETQAGPITLLMKVASVVFDEPMNDAMFEPPSPAPPAP